MIYEFSCTKCQLTKEVYRHHTEASDPEFCTICGEQMKRMYSAPLINIPNTSYNIGLGCPQNKVQDKLKQHSDTTGEHLVEIGNESIKPKIRKPYEYTEECLKAKQQLGL